MYFTPGDLGFPVFDVDGVRVGVQICYDRQFPEGYRCLALDGAQIIFTPTVLATHGNPARSEMWPLMLRARAIENGCFVVGVGKAGRENDTDHVGDSLLISPLGGRVLAKAQTEEDELVVADFDLDEVVEARRRLPFGRDRRPRDYGAVAAEGE
jgi:predicted amidohydrolase